MQQNQNILVSAHEKKVLTIEKKMIGDVSNLTEDQKKQQVFDYHNYQSEFMHLDQDNPHHQPKKNNPPSVLSKHEVEKSLTEIYAFYAKAYLRSAIQKYESFDQLTNYQLKFQAFLLFAKHFGILKTIFSTQKITLIFKKHADYGKFLSFDNFYFLINSLSHEPEAKTFFNLTSMIEKLDVETVEEVEKQQFYSYLTLDNPSKYTKKMHELFEPFNCNKDQRNSKIKYNYRKFSLPELRKKAIPDHKEVKKSEKDLFILKSNKQIHQNVFDEAKSIVVSWDSLRAKSVNNLGKPAEYVEKKYVKNDPEDQIYMNQYKPDKKSERVGKIQKKIKEIEEMENIKNKQILLRIEKKTSNKRVLKIT